MVGELGRHRRREGAGLLDIAIIIAGQAAIVAHLPAGILDLDQQGDHRIVHADVGGQAVGGLLQKVDQRGAGLVPAVRDAVRSLVERQGEVVGDLGTQRGQGISRRADGGELGGGQAADRRAVGEEFAHGRRGALVRLVDLGQDPRRGRLGGQGDAAGAALHAIVLQGAEQGLAGLGDIRGALGGAPLGDQGHGVHGQDAGQQQQGSAEQQLVKGADAQRGHDDGPLVEILLLLDYFAVAPRYKNDGSTLPPLQSRHVSDA